MKKVLWSLGLLSIFLLIGCGGGSGGAGGGEDDSNSSVSINIDPTWSVDFFGLIRQIKFADFDDDGKNEIVAGGEQGIFVLNEDGKLLWRDKRPNGVETLFVYDQDSDSKPEVATVGWLDIHIFDDNGSRIKWSTMKPYSSFKLPAALLGRDVVSYTNDGYDDTHDGLKFANQYDIFYPTCDTYETCESFDDVPPNGLASVDTDDDGIYDVLYGIADMNKSFKLDIEGKKIWQKELDFASNYIWAGKDSSGKQVELIAQTWNGHIRAIDKDGNKLWDQILTSIEDIVHDENGGFIVSTYDQNGICKLNENNGSIEWCTDYYVNDIAQGNNQIAASHGTGVKLLNQDGVILHEANISSFNSTYYTDEYLLPEYLAFGESGGKSGLYVASLDLHRMDSDGSIHKIFSGGTLIQKLESGDMDSDGKDEIVAQDRHRLYLYDSNGELLWLKDKVELFNNVKFADFSGNGKMELVTSNEENITVFNKQGDQIWSIEPASRAELIETYDYNSDGAQDLFVGDRDGYIKVYDGKNGNELHNYGDRSHNEYVLRILNIDGNKRLYYVDNSTGYLNWVKIDDILGETNTTELKCSWVYKYNFTDYNHDGTMELMTGLQVGNSFEIKIWNLAQEEIVSSFELTSDDDLKEVKFVDIENNGTYDVLVVSTGKTALYKTDGTKLWEFVINSERGLSKALTYDKHIYVAGKEIYVLDKNGKNTEIFSPSNYMSDENYFIKPILAKKGSTETQFVVGSMGIFGFSVSE